MNWFKSIWCDFDYLAPELTAVCLMWSVKRFRQDRVSSRQYIITNLLMKKKSLLRALTIAVTIPALAAAASQFDGAPWGNMEDARKIASAHNGGVSSLEPNMSDALPPTSRVCAMAAASNSAVENSPVTVYGVMAQNRSYQTPRVCGFTVGGDFNLQEYVTANDWSLSMTQGGFYAPDGSYYAFTSSAIFRYDTNDWGAGLKSETKLDTSDSGKPTAITYDVTTGNVYGCFMDEFGMWPASYSFCSLDLTTGKVTKIASLPGGDKGIAYGIAANAKGDIYIILGHDTDTSDYLNSYYPALYRVDKVSGELTRIGNTGMKFQKSYFGAAFDHKSGRMLWSVDSQYNSGAIFEVNLETGSCTKLLDTPNGEQFCSIAIPYTVISSEAPALLTDLTVEFTDAEGNGTVSFTMPVETYGGSALEGEVSYTVKCGDEVLAQGTGAPGSKVDKAVSVSARGKVKIEVSLRGGADNSESVSETDTFVGNDTPASPSKVTASAKGNEITMSWTAPEKGANGGFIDRKSLKYKVVLLPSGEVVSESATATEMTYTAAFTEPVALRLSVTPVCSDIEGEAAVSENFVAGPGFKMPWSDNFTDAGSFDLYTIVDVAGDGATWERYSGNDESYLQCVYSASNPKDDWLFTPALHLEVGVDYTLSFKASSLMVNAFPEVLEVMMGESATPTAMTATLLAAEKIDNKESWTWFDYSLAIKVEKEGDYHLGFHAISAANQFKLAIDDLRLEGSPFDAPMPVADMEVVAAPWGVHSATLKFRAPEKANNGETLSSLSDAEVYVNNRLFKTILNPEPGSWQTVVLETEDGHNNIDIYTSNEAGRSISARTEIYTGADKPGVAGNFRANVNGNTVHLTWDVPAGANGGTVNPETMNYKLGRYVNGGDIEVLTLGIGNVCEYDDVCDFTEQTTVIYVLSSENEVGFGATTISNCVIVGGEGYPLPFAESFTSGFTTYPIWENQVVDHAGTSAWVLWEKDYGLGVEPYDSDKGAIFFNPVSVGDKTRLLSGCIDLSTARHPVLEFRYRGYRSTGQKLTVESCVDDIWEPMREIVLDGTSDEWTLVKIPLNRYNYLERFQFAFLGEAVNLSRIFIDDITIRDVYDNDLSVSLKARKNYYPGEPQTVAAEIANVGEKDAGCFKVQLYDGERLLSEVEKDGLAVDASLTVEFTHEIDLGYADTSELTAKIVYEADDNRSNNVSSKEVRNHLPLYPAPEHLVAWGTPQAYEFEWQEPVAWNEPKAEPVTDDFESYEPFIIDEIGDWTTVDVSGSAGTFGILGMHYPYREEAKSWQVFNLWALGIEMGDDDVTWRPNSGHQFLVSFCDKDRRTDDWLISPVLTGEAQTISFMTRSLNTFAYGEETFEVYASDSGRELSDFRLIYFGSAPSTWSRTTVDLPEGIMYFAIRCNSEDKFVMGLDDITYTPGTGMPKSFELTGYNLYRNSRKVNDAVIDGLNYTTSGSENDSFAVTAVYTTGESRFSNVAVPSGAADVLAEGSASVSVCDGLIAVTGADDKAVSVYTVDGMIIFSGYGDCNYAADRGIYMVKVGESVFKVLVK